MSGNSTGSSLNVTQATTITEDYTTQYYLTFAQSGVGSDFTGNVMSVDYVNYSSTGYSAWINSGTSIPFSYYSPLVVTANGEQYLLTGVSGNSTGSSLNVTQATTITGNYTTQYYLTFAQSGVGSDFTGNVMSVDYVNYSSTGYSAWINSGTSIPFSYYSPLVVTANGEQYLLTGVSGNSTGSSLNVTQATTITGNYTTQYYLTFAQSGVGSDFSGNVMMVNGTGYGIAGFATWANPGDVYTFSYASPLVVTANGEQYLLTGVSGNSTGSSLNVTQATTITEDYTTQYYLTVSSAYGTAGGAGWYNSGTSATATVTPLTVAGATGTQYVFNGWSGDASGTASSSNAITMNGPKTAIVKWETQYYLTVSSTYGSPSPSSGWFDSGSSITDFVASPVSGGSGARYVCTGWSGSGSVPASGSASAATFTINAPSTITWTWNTQYLVSFATNPSHAGTTSPSGTNVWENAGATSIYANTTSTDYTFSSWSSNTGNITFEPAATSSTTATINGPGTITANISSNNNATILYVSVGVVIAIVVGGSAATIFLRRRKAK